MARAFEHPGHIPIPVALAIRGIACNEATADDWETLDRIDRGTCLEWIAEIWQANNWDRPAANLAWFAAELAKADN